MSAPATQAGSRPHAGFDRVDTILYVLLVSTWSTSWIGIRLQLGPAPPEVSLFWRYTLATALLFVLVLARGGRIAFPWRTHAMFALMGLLLFSANFLCFYYAGVVLPSGLLALVFSMASLFNLLLAVPLLGERIEAGVAVGALIGFAGLLVIFVPRVFGAGFDHLGVVGLALGIAGTLSFCLGNMVSARTQRAGIDVISSTAWGMGYGTVMIGLVGLARGFDFVVVASPTYWFAMVYLAVVSSVVGFVSYLALLGRIGAARTGYSTVVFPIIALLISTVFEGYVWTLAAALGLALVVVGNIVVMRRR